MGRDRRRWVLCISAGVGSARFVERMREVGRSLRLVAGAIALPLAMPALAFGLENGRLHHFTQSTRLHVHTSRWDNFDRPTTMA